ncbi:MAG: hypothetical protein H7336_07615 [Bacteriovorax sp.]|nr:hypothetical protein [Bacteriovorax sp.]
MKFFLWLTTAAMLVSSCSSVDSIKKNENCVVWKDQKVWGPYSVEVINKKADWTGSCKGYNRGCDEVHISLDENNNVLSNADVLGKIENNELQFAEKHALADIMNFTGVRVYPDLKTVKSSIIVNKITTEESFLYNDKCSAEESITGAIALGLIGKSQNKDVK